MQPLKTLAPGIHQSDVVIRAALVYGIEDLRAKPHWLRYVFSSLPYDELTASEYGQAQVEEAIRWFQNTDIPVLMAFKITDGPPPLPCISIALMDSKEGEATLADVHYDVKEDLDESRPWPVLSGPLYGVSYDPVSGKFSMPAGSTFVLSRGHVVVTKTGQSVPVLRGTVQGTALLPKNLGYDFDGCTIRGQKRTRQVSLESLVFNESYLIGCHAKGDPAQLLYLHSIVVFCLLRYKQRLLEARGFGESTMVSTDLRQSEAFKALGLAEPAYSRYVSLNGKVRHYWPKDEAEPIYGTNFVPEYSSPSDLDPGANDPIDPEDPYDIRFYLDADPVSLTKR